MLSEITSALSSLKVASDIIKGFNSLKVEATVKEKSTELLNIIISLQHSIFSLQSEYEKLSKLKSALEDELQKLKEWDSIKNKFILKEVAPDTIAYVHKDSSEAASDKHWLCANCFDNEKIESIYQIKIRGNRLVIFIIARNVKMKFL
jgi:DNA repair exonuclease SbcCD ATPase subunit